MGQPDVGLNSDSPTHFLSGLSLCLNLSSYSSLIHKKQIIRYWLHRVIERIKGQAAWKTLSTVLDALNKENTR